MKGVSMEEKKGVSLPIKIIIIGCALGLIIAGIGGIKQLAARKTNEDRKKVALKESEDAVNEANKRLDEIVEEYDALKAQYEEKSSECDSIVTGSDDWFAKKNKCIREQSELQDRIWALEEEDALIKAKDYNAYYVPVKPMTYQIFYIIGGSVAGLALLGAFIIYLVKGKKTY